MKNVVLSFVALACCSIAIGQASQPILTLNTQMHTAKILRISADKPANTILTCSTDKTAKLWDANTGALIRTFRVPMESQGSEGMLYSCALSPDGLVAAVGGWTGLAWSGTLSVYLFNTNTGEMFKRITGLADVANDLEFSPDGRYLAVDLGTGNGIGIYSTRTWSLEKTLSGCGVYSANIAFDVNGRLASVCNDGKIRLYSPAFELLGESGPNAGKSPGSLCFSPDGHKLAVGYADSPRLQVFDTESDNITLLYEPDVTVTGSATNVIFRYVAFSADGKYLYAGFSNLKFIEGKWWNQLRRWDNAGRGGYSDLPVNQIEFCDIIPVADGSIVYCGTKPDLGRIAGDGKIIFYRSSEVCDFNVPDKSHLKVNRDASVVGITPYLSVPLTVSVGNGEIVENQSREPAFADKAAGVEVTDWNASAYPKLNGGPLSFLYPGEICRCVDISPDAKNIVFGGQYYLYCLDGSGQTKWKTQTNELTWSVKIAGNQKVAVATIGNGTVEWYRMSDGKKILSLFISPENNRWILWTPSGYYKCSAGAENLVGWHVNDGPDKAAVFYTISKFRDAFYRPDIVDRMLETMDEGEALRLADLESNRQTQARDVSQMLPPSIQINSPFNGTPVSAETVTVKYSITSPNSKPVLGIRVLIDGNLFKDTDLTGQAGETGKIPVTIPARNCKVSLLARNEFGFSEPAEIALSWNGTTGEVVKPKPNLYILAVGISDYDKPGLQLKLAAKDARDFCAAMQKQKGLLYSDVIIKLLTDKEAVKDSIVVGLDWLKEKTTADDKAIIFLAGHGMNDNWNTFYFLAVGSDPQKISTTGLMYASIQNTVAKLHGTKLVFADACHSGNIMAGWAAPDMNGFINGLTTAEKGAIVFTSSAGNQTSLENPAWGNGAFTKALLEGIGGKANFFDDDMIMVKNLDSYVSNRVKKLTEGKQTPTTIIPGTVISDFPIAVVNNTN